MSDTIIKCLWCGNDVDGFEFCDDGCENAYKRYKRIGDENEQLKKDLQKATRQEQPRCWNQHCATCIVKDTECSNEFAPHETVFLVEKAAKNIFSILPGEWDDATKHNVYSELNNLAIEIEKRKLD